MNLRKLLFINLILFLLVICKSKGDDWSKGKSRSKEGGGVTPRNLCNTFTGCGYVRPRSRLTSRAFGSKEGEDGEKPFWSSSSYLEENQDELALPLAELIALSEERSVSEQFPDYEDLSQRDGDGFQA